MGDTGALHQTPRMTEADAADPIRRLHDDAAGRRAWETEVQGYVVALQAQRKSPNTILAYTASLARWAKFCETSGRSLDPQAATRRDAQAFLADLQASGRPATTLTRFVAVKTFFSWLASEEEAVLAASPFAGVRKPTIPEVNVPVVKSGDLQRLLETCDGRSFEDRRDRALILLLASTGMRRGELAGLLLGDLDLVEGRVQVRGKGDRSRWTGFGAMTQDALRLYLRVRAAHRDADLIVSVGTHADDRRQGPALFLVAVGTGHRGRLQDAGIGTILIRRARQAGIAPIHPHQLRHTWAHQSLLGGMSEGDAMRLGGWRTRVMLDRYGREGASERALAAYRDPVDRMLQAGRGRKSKVRG